MKKITSWKVPLAGRVEKDILRVLSGHRSVGVAHANSLQFHNNQGANTRLEERHGAFHISQSHKVMVLARGDTFSPSKGDTFSPSKREMPRFDSAPRSSCFLLLYWQNIEFYSRMCFIDFNYNFFMKRALMFKKFL